MQPRGASPGWKPVNRRAPKGRKNSCGADSEAVPFPNILSRGTHDPRTPTTLQRNLHTGKISALLGGDGRTQRNARKVPHQRDAVFFPQGAAGPDVAIWQRTHPSAGRPRIPQGFLRIDSAQSSTCLMKRRILCLSRWILGWCGMHRGSCNRNSSSLQGFPFPLCISSFDFTALHGGLRA